MASPSNKTNPNCQDRQCTFKTRSENTFKKVPSEHEPSIANEITFFRVVEERLQNCLTSPTGPTATFCGYGFQPFG